MNLRRLISNIGKRRQDPTPIVFDYTFRENKNGPLSEEGKILSGYEWRTQVISELDNGALAQKLATKIHMIYYDARDGRRSLSNRTKNPYFSDQLTRIYFDEDELKHLIFIHLYIRNDENKDKQHGKAVFTELMELNKKDIDEWAEWSKEEWYKQGSFIARRDENSDNLHAFVKNIEQGMSVTEAIKYTFTGKMLFRNAYKYISKVIILYQDNQVHHVYVFFDNYIRSWNEITFKVTNEGQ